MRRTLTLVSIGLVLLGLELATRIVGTLAARLIDGFRALGSGTAGVVSTERFSVGVILVTAGVVMAMLGEWAGRRRRAIEAAGKTCPRCAQKTTRVRRRLRQRLLAHLIGEPLTRRHCNQCGWEGLALKS